MATKLGLLGHWLTLIFVYCSLCRGDELLLSQERCIDVHGAAFAGLNAAAGKLVALQQKTDGVCAGGDLDASRRELAGGNAVHENLRASGSGVYLCPGDMTGSRLEFEIQGGLNVVLHLDLAGIGLVTFEPKDQVVRACGEGESGGGLPGLFIAVNEDVGASWTGVDEEAVGQRFEEDLLILGIAGLEFEGGLDLSVAFFLNLQAIAGRDEVVEAARCLTGSSGAARGVKNGGLGADYIGENANGSIAIGWDGMAAVVGILRSGERRVVVGDFINYADACGGVAHEVQERRMLRGTQLAG